MVVTKRISGPGRQRLRGCGAIRRAPEDEHNEGTNAPGACGAQSPESAVAGVAGRRPVRLPALCSVELGARRDRREERPPPTEAAARVDGWASMGARFVEWPVLDSN